MRPTLLRIRIVCSAIGVAALLAAALMMLLPLPVQDLGVLQGPLYCGPGASSDNTLQIMLDPEVVNQDGSPLPTAGRSPEETRKAEAQREREAIQICQGAAKPRFIWTVVLVIVAVVVGLAVPSIVGAARHRSPEAS